MVFSFFFFPLYLPIELIFLLYQINKKKEIITINILQCDRNF